MTTNRNKNLIIKRSVLDGTGLIPDQSWNGVDTCILTNEYLHGTYEMATTQHEYRYHQWVCN
jgi:hypothetical protein